MADVTKTVLTKFEADTRQYDAAIEASAKGTDNLTEAQKDQEKQTVKGAKANEKYAGSIGSQADAIGKLIPGFDKISSGFKKSEAAAKQFGLGTKAALIATGIGALIVAVGALVSKFSELRDKSGGDLSFIETKFVELGNSIRDKVLNQLDGLLQALQVLFPALIPIIATYKALNDEFERTKELAGQATVILNEEVLNLDRRLQVSRELNVSQLELLRLEKELLNAKIRAKPEEEFQLNTALDLLDIREAKLLQDQRELDIINQKLLLAPAITEVEAVTTNLLVSQVTTQDEINERLRTRIALTKESTDATLQAATAEQTAAAQKVVAEKAFQQAIFKTQIGQKFNAAKAAVIDGKKAITAIWAQSGATFALKAAQSVIVAGITLKQIKDILAVQFTAPAFAEGGQVPGKTGGMIRGRSHRAGGVKFAIGGYAAEAEGGEFIVNRSATRNFLPVLKAINSTGLRKYQDGGEVTNIQSDISRTSSELRDAVSRSQTVLVLEDFRRASNRLQVVEDLSNINTG